MKITDAISLSSWMAHFFLLKVSANKQTHNFVETAVAAEPDKQGRVPILDSVAVIFGYVSNSIIALRLVAWTNNILRVFSICFLDSLPS